MAYITNTGWKRAWLEPTQISAEHCPSRTIMPDSLVRPDRPSANPTFSMTWILRRHGIVARHSLEAAPRPNGDLVKVQSRKQRPCH